MDMSANTHEKRLLFLRRMIWWLPPLAFAIWASLLWGFFYKFSGGSLMDAVVQALMVGVVVGIICAAVYFGYKYMLDRNPNM
ncbi:MAG TPA: hypothetical protein VM536_05665 [Chloroflexia bacterium]|nr:hypothetical protein [Chloroflexia bacterium]